MGGPTKVSLGESGFGGNVFGLYDDPLGPFIIFFGEAVVFGERDERAVGGVFFRNQLLVPPEAVTN